jgi:hypothetical protein
MNDSRYIDTAEAAKMLRPQLRKNFPGVKFSVRIDRYAGGSSIDVKWTDGPTAKQVEEIAHGFRGRRFDGMDDLSYGADSWYCPEHGARASHTWGTGDERDDVVSSRCCAQAELVHFGSGYVTANRTLSPEFEKELAKLVAHESGMSGWDMNTRLPEGSVFHYYPFDRVRDGVYRLSCDISR